MSLSDDRVEVVSRFLQNRASLGRLTTYRELGRVVREHAYTPTHSRDELAEVLRAVDDTSLVANNVLLSSLVVHFADNNAGHRFFEQAIERGLLPADPDEDTRRAFHAHQVDKAFATFVEPVLWETESDDAEAESV